MFLSIIVYLYIKNLYTYGHKNINTSTVQNWYRHYNGFVVIR